MKNEHKAITIHEEQMNKIVPLFIATRRFDPSDGEKWESYSRWAKIPGLVEIVSLDCLLCPYLVKEFQGGDWQHIVNEDFRLNYFYNLNYLKQRVRDVKRWNMLGLYWNSEKYIAEAPGPGDFTFLGYDLTEEQTGISALTNYGGFPDVFANEELNRVGLIENFERASEVRRFLSRRHPEEPHAQCELYAIWRLIES